MKSRKPSRPRRKRVRRELAIGLKELRARLPILHGYLRERERQTMPDRTMNMMTREDWR